MKSLFNLFDPNGDELCGVIYEDGTVVSLPNIHPNPRDNFAMSVEPLQDPKVIATWHTHPRTSANLSVEDYRAFVQFPRLRHYVVAATEIWCYRMAGDILVLDDNYLSTRLPARPSP